ncbi:hypothetical protein Aduo_014505 [Ancylostoma duodenale]
MAFRVYSVKSFHCFVGAQKTNCIERTTKAIRSVISCTAHLWQKYDYLALPNPIAGHNERKILTVAEQSMIKLAATATTSDSATVAHRPIDVQPPEFYNYKFLNDSYTDEVQRQ